MTYTLTSHPNTILRNDDQAYIPTDPANTDYQAYLQWLGQGNHPTAAPVTVTTYSSPSQPTYEPPPVTQQSGLRGI